MKLIGGQPQAGEAADKHRSDPFREVPDRDNRSLAPWEPRIMRDSPASSMSAEPSPTAPKAEETKGYEFGQFLLDTDRHLLLKGDRFVALTPKTYDLLLLLVESGGRLLLKDELMKALWPNSFVEESNLTQQISMIRKALRESPGEDRGRGFLPWAIAL